MKKIDEAKSFLKTIPGIITGVAAALGVLWAIFRGSVAIATAPVAERVESLETQQQTNIQNISDNTDAIKEFHDESLANDYRIYIAIMIAGDMGKGAKKDAILFYYDELRKLCGECPSTEADVNNYLDSL